MANVPCRATQTAYTRLAMVLMCLGTFLWREPAYAEAPVVVEPTGPLPSAMWLDGYVHPELFPDWRRDVELKTVVQGQKDKHSPWRIMVSLNSSVPAYVTLVHYDNSGNVNLGTRSLPVMSGAHVTLTLDAANPPGTGMLRLILWREPPAPAGLSEVVNNPNAVDEPVRGIIHQVWKTDAVESSAQYPPWKDPWRNLPDPPVALPWDAWPLACATISSNNKVVAKDCSIRFLGTTTTGLDEYGAFGRWQLDWPNDLSITFEVNPDTFINNADLYIYGQAVDSVSMQTSDPLDIIVNGWNMDSSGIGYSFTTGMQPISVSVSQYLERGSNTVEVALDPFSHTEWLIDGIYIWVY